MKTRTLTVKNLNTVKPNDYPHLHPSLTKPPFFSVINGARHSGKSNLVKNLIFRKEFYGDVFDHENIIYISPTIFIDDNAADFPADVKKYNKFSDKLIQDIMNQLEEIKDAQGKENVPDMLLVLDDLGAESKVMGRGGTVEMLSFISRHFNLSVIVIVQKYNSVCPGIRGNADLQIFFRPLNLGAYDAIAEEHSDKATRKAFKKMTDYIWETPYSFLTIQFKKPVDEGRYMKNFEEVLQLETYLN